MTNGYRAITVLLLATFVVWYRRNAVHFYRQILTEDTDDEYDFIVVGGGSAGSVVSARLSEIEDSKVLLIEAGSFFGDSEAFFVPLRWTEAFGTEYDWGYFSEPQTHAHFAMKGHKIYIPRGRVLGGTGMLNGLVYARGSPTDFDLWEQSGCKGWAYDKVLPYFIKTEDIQIQELRSSRYHGSGGLMAVSKGPDSQLTNAYLKAGEELGYNATDYNGADIVGVSPAQFNIRNGVRSTSSIEYLGYLRQENLHISVRSFATKIEIHDNRAVGVYYVKNGKKKYVKARKEIVVSAGAIDSPKLLMLSGIGPKDHLQELGITVVADLPVGSSLFDHAGVPVHSKINKPYAYTMDEITSLWSSVQYLFGVGPLASTGLGAMAFLHYNLNVKEKNKPDVQFEFINMLLGNKLFNFKNEVAEEFWVNDPNAHGFTVLISPTRLRNKGSLKLRSSDPFDDPKIDLNFLSDKEDIADLISAIRVWEKLMETPTMKELGVDIGTMKMSFCSEQDFRSDAYWECYIRHLLMSMFHFSGTCKMGDEHDSSAVLDPELRVKGISGLRVADASIFPHITSANPNAPIVMVAEKVADLVKNSNSYK